jgi:hypothetical protein
VYLVDGLLLGALSLTLGGGGESGESRGCIRVTSDLISFELELAVLFLCVEGRCVEDVDGIEIPSIDDWEVFRELPASED